MGGWVGAGKATVQILSKKKKRFAFILIIVQKCSYFFLLLFSLRGGWVGQQQSEHCSDLENGMEKWMLSKIKIIQVEEKRVVDHMEL